MNLEEALEQVGIQPSEVWDQEEHLLWFAKIYPECGNIRDYLGCNGDNCCEAVKIVPGEEIKFVWEADNLYDKNAVQVYDQREKLIGYVPRYYAEAFAAFIKEKRVKKGKILCVDKNRNCDECIKIEVSVAGV